MYFYSLPFSGLITGLPISPNIKLLLQHFLHSNVSVSAKQHAAAAECNRSDKSVAQLAVSDCVDVGTAIDW